MIDLSPAPVPKLSEEWIDSHRLALVDALTEPRRRPLRWVALAGSTAAATIATLFLSLFFLVGGSAPDAFAGWSASPTTPTAGQLSTADAACEASVAHLPPTNKGIDAASLRPELSDVRGPYTVIMFGNGAQNQALCVSAPNATALRWIVGSGAPVGPGAIAVDQVSFLARDGQPYTLVVGRAGTGVTGVTLTLENGGNVTATTGNGRFIAWWPGSQGISSAAVATATGVSTQTLNLPGPGNPPPTKSSPLPPGSQSSSSAASSPSAVCLIHNCG